MIGIGATLFKVPTAYGALAFSPASLFANGEKGAWYDISDLSTLFQEDGTTPSTPGDRVGKIEDKSGNGNHMIQTTDTKCPILRLGGDGLYYLEFDGTDDGMRTNSNVTVSSANEMSVFTAVRVDAASTVQNVLELSNNIGSQSGAFRIFVTSGNILRSIQKGTVANTVQTGALTAPFKSVITSLGDISAPRHLFRDNGSDVGDVSTGLGTGNYGDHQLNLGARNNASSSNLEGRFYGGIIRAANSTADEIADVEKYLASKSGVTL